MTKAVLNTNTELRLSGSNFGIYTFYTPYDKNIEAFISETVKSINGVDFIEGEGGYTNNGFENTIFFVNEYGELIVTSNVADRFNLDATTGQLQYTE
jgi:hypothetical protein